MLQGRSKELGFLIGLLERAAAGHGFALLVHGDPGIGKTALLQQLGAMAAADGALVLGASGFEAEAALPYETLRTLAEPLLDRRDRLPPGQAQAFGTALALEPPTPHDRFAIPVALLALLAAAAEERPVVAIVDDLHWVDPASREAFLFAARRLTSGRVALILAARDRDGAPLDAPGVERLALEPLDGDSARALLARGDRVLADAVADQVTSAAAGNPLALIEISASLTPAQRMGSSPIQTPLRLGPLLEEAFARSRDDLPLDARRAITVAATMEAGSVGWLLDALAELGLAPSALDAAERAQALSVVGGQVAFRHPLVRAAAYHAAADEDRREAHQALAATTPDPPRRAWHLAAAAGGEDAGVAAALDEAAVHARAVGGHLEAASAFIRAAELSTGDRERGRRELEAAQELAVAGEAERALTLLESAASRAGRDHQSRIAALRGNLAMRRGDPDGALRELLAEAERRLAAADPAAALPLLIEASVAPMLTGDTAELERIIERARGVAREVGGPQQVLVELLAAEQLVVRGREREGDAALAAIEPRLAELDVLAVSEVVAMAAQTSILAGSDDRAERIVKRILDDGRENGALGRLPYALTVQALLEQRRGRWPDALAHAGEAVRLARDTGQATMLSYALSVLARLTGARGGLDVARGYLEQAQAFAQREGALGIEVHAIGARAFVEVAAGHFDEAVAPARRAAEIEDGLGLRHRAFTAWAPELVEALAATGRRDEAEAEVERLAAWSRESGSPWGAAMTARGRVMLAGEDEIDVLAVEAVAAHEALGLPFESARNELAIGERLRRGRRRTDAREPLGRALTAFERLGAEPFARRVRAGLEATGTSRRSESQTGLAQLSTPERRIAALVAEGRTNREIAAELLLSEKTLERRLTGLYRRLGIASRSELARLLASG